MTRKDERRVNQFVPAAAGQNTHVHPVRRSQCLVNGMFLFDGAAWSPDACSVCQCREGDVHCHAVPCLLSAPDSPTSKPAVKQQKPVMGVKTSQRKSSQQNGKPLAGKTVEVKPKIRIPAAAAKKPAFPPATIRRQDVPKPKTKSQWWDRVPSVVHNSETMPGPRIVERRRFDNDDHDDDDFVDDNSDSEDDDDDDGIILINRSNIHTDRLAITDRLASAGRQASPDRLTSSQKVASANRVAPDTMAVFPAHNPAVSPTQRPLAPPTKQSVVLPPGRPLPMPSGRSGGIGVGRPVLRPYIHMESLPAGCLLSESLVACGSTGLTQLPLLKDAGVRALYLADNKISKIPMRALAGLPNLEWLDLSKNKLDDSSLGLDVFRNLTKLRRLNLDGNNLTKVPALPSSLLELKINDNRLSGLTPHSFKGLSQLLTLELEDNHFHDGNVSPLAFRNLGKLIYLRLDDNDFRAIPSGLPASLQELHLSDNRIEVIHAGLLNKTINLRVLNLGHNKIREDRIAPRAWIHLRKLESLDLSYNKLVHVPSFLPVGLRQLTLHHNQIERIPGYVFGHLKPGLDSLHLSYNRLHEDGINEVSFLGLYHSLTELLLDHNQLRAIPRGILQLRALQLLRLNHNFISSVPMNSLCDSTARDDSPLLSVHLQYNLIDRRLIPHAALSCIRTYHSVILRPQKHEHIHE